MSFPPSSLASWAAARGLRFTPEGLLPPATRLLEDGVGRGAHRAGLLVSETRHGTTTVDGFTKRPERFTWNLCAGGLPGELDGTLAHHHSLVLGYGAGDEVAWTAVPDTVVLARVPAAVRVVRDLRGSEGVATVRALISFGKADTPPAPPRPMAGWTWLATPGEDDATLAALLDDATQEALRRAPAGTRVELWDGNLCVSARGALEDGAALDALCFAAAAVAGALRREAARQEPAAAGARLSVPPENPWQRSVTAGAARIAWPEPPTSLGVAVAAYAALPGRGARRTRARVRAVLSSLAGGLTGLVVLGLLLKLFGASDATAVATGAFGALVLGPASFVAALRSAGREADESSDADAAQSGLEAFVEGYARTRGLAVEDRDAFRRAYPVPHPGVPLRAMGGRLGPAGVPGHLALWIDRTDRTETRYALVAVVTGPEGEPIILHEPIAAEDRSAACLDDLAEAAARAAGAAPVARASVLNA